MLAAELDMYVRWADLYSAAGLIGFGAAASVGIGLIVRLNKRRESPHRFRRSPVMRQPLQRPNKYRKFILTFVS
jgi:hypothetical protein